VRSVHFDVAVSTTSLHLHPMLEHRNLKLDLLALVLCAAVVFLALAVFTYDPADPLGPGASSHLVYPAPADIQNACGRLGAVAAYGLLMTIGVGTYYLVFSLAVVDVMLLTRREISWPTLRTLGWGLSLVGFVTFAAMVLPTLSPGPVIGPGGYLGALGRGWLETNFATTGGLILTVSVILGGLLMCTDYLLIRAAAWGLRVPVAILRNTPLPKRAAKVAIGDAAEDAIEDEEYEDEDYEIEEEEAEEPAPLNVKISGKPVEVEAEAEEEEDELEQDEEEEYEEVAEDEEVEEEELEEVAEETQKPVGAKNRLASLLRVRDPRKRKDEAREEVMTQLDEAVTVDDVEEYELPPVDMLLDREDFDFDTHEKEVRRKAKVLEQTFRNFGFTVRVVEIETGPVIAQYEIELETGLRLSKITGLSDDIAIALRVPSVRIVAPVPGKNTIAVEVPNAGRQVVRLREVMEETNGRVRAMDLPIFLGKDVAGNPMTVDLAKMPHLLIAGRTGTGKSVCLNSLIVSLLMTRRPDEVKLLLIDPKMVELSPYKRLPHLMHPVVTDMKKAEAILAWAVEKMEQRYQLLANAGVRHINSYNQLGRDEVIERVKPQTQEEEDAIPAHMPFIVVVADEIADLMMTAGKEVEHHIIRLAQKSRAVGIHLILATQKPTVDVVTGLIKSNLPARICFQVASRTDSRVVLDEMGADKLLGNGDMLFLSPGTSQLLRGQGTFLSDDEISDVLNFVGTTEPQFSTELVNLHTEETDGAAGGGNPFQDRDEHYEQAVEIVIREGRGSVSLLQRTLSIGYGRAARLIDFMAEDGVVGAYSGSKAREVVMTMEEFAALSGGEVPPEPEPKPAARRNRIVPSDEDEKLNVEAPPRPSVVAVIDDEPDEGEQDEYEEEEYEEEEDVVEEESVEEEEYEDDESEEEEEDESEYEVADSDEAYEDDEYEDEEEAEYEEDEYEDDENEQEDESEAATHRHAESA
jgi:S-DNA-T family DNA segregation ATPase FtsK/SpoIIIE